MNGEALTLCQSIFHFPSTHPQEQDGSFCLIIDPWLYLYHCVSTGPLQSSCLENPEDGGAWWAMVHGVTESRTRLKWLSMHACAVLALSHVMYYNYFSFLVPLFVSLELLIILLFPLLSLHCMSVSSWTCLSRHSSVCSLLSVSSWRLLLWAYCSASDWASCL